MTPWRYTLVGHWLRSTKQTTRRDIALIACVSLFFAAALGILAYGLYANALNNLL